MSILKTLLLVIVLIIGLPTLAAFILIATQATDLYIYITAAVLGLVIMFGIIRLSDERF